MGRITLILGGARSGKSKLALELAKNMGKKVAFVATSQALDKEMKRRILVHKRARPQQWKTFEESTGLPILLRRIGNKFEIIIIDCLTLWASNLLLKGIREKAIEARTRQLCRILKETRANVIIVSNEVGMGIVPQNKLAREFRDIAGKINQYVARCADEAFIMFSGLPLKLK